MIAERVDKVLREQLGEGFNWTADSRLLDDLSLDYLDVAGLANGLEKEFRKVIADDALAEWVTVGDIVRWLETHDLPVMFG